MPHPSAFHRVDNDDVHLSRKALSPSGRGPTPYEPYPTDRGVPASPNQVGGRRSSMVPKGGNENRSHAPQRLPTMPALTDNLSQLWHQPSTGPPKSVVSSQQNSLPTMPALTDNLSRLWHGAAPSEPSQSKQGANYPSPCSQFGNTASGEWRNDKSLVTLGPAPPGTISPAALQLHPTPVVTPALPPAPPPLPIGNAFLGGNSKVPTTHKMSEVPKGSPRSPKSGSPRKEKAPMKLTSKTAQAEDVVGFFTETNHTAKRHVRKFLRRNPDADISFFEYERPAEDLN